MHNRQQIMNRAWAIMADRPRNRINWVYALRQAWQEAKDAARRADMTEANHIREAIGMLENKDTWSDADYRRHDDLVAALKVALDHEANADAYAVKRALIAKAKGQFVSITFTKKDGSLRTMRVQPATLPQRVRSNSASDVARRAAVTRTRRHPHLMPVWDVDAGAPRSVNLATVSRIAAGGAVHTYQ